MKKLILSLVIFTLFLGARFAYAEVIINEVQLSPTEERFIELYNSGSSSVDLTNWYIQRKTQTGSTFGSLVSKTYFENKSINAGSYFLISHDSIPNADIVLSSLTLTESNTIQLKNLDQEVVEKVGWGEANDCNGTCAPNPTTGKSIQKTGGDWIIATPTPGEENETLENIEENNNTENNNSDNTSGSSSPKKTEIQEPKIPLVNKTKILVKTPAFAGLPAEFMINNTVSNDSCGKYFWNFGDGNSEEIKKTFPVPKTYPHIYYYEGEYVVTLECYKSYLSSEPDSSDKITIKIVSSDVSISRVGDAKDFFIEISNNAPYEADISNWVLSSYQNRFVFPKNTILKSKNKIVVSPKTTNFSILDKDTLALINSEGEIISRYISSLKPVKTSIQNFSATETKSSLGGETAELEDEEIFSEKLEAAAIKSDSSTGNNIMYGIGLFAFLGASAGGAYFIRNRKRRDTFGPIGNNFEIIDE